MKDILPYSSAKKKINWQRHDNTTTKNRVGIEESCQYLTNGVNTLFGVAGDIESAEAIVDKFMSKN